MKKILVLSAFLAVLIGCQKKEAPKAVAPVPAAAEAPAAVSDAVPTPEKAPAAAPAKK